MTIRIAGAMVVALFLAACGGGSGSGAEGTSGGPGDATGSGPGDTPGTGAGGGDEPVVTLLDPADGVLGRLPAGLSVSYDPASDAVTLDDGTGPVVFTRGPIDDDTAFRNFDNYEGPGPGFSVLLRADTGSGGGTASVVWFPVSGELGTVYSRLSDTELPGSGSGVFSGSYAGLIVDPAGRDDNITGDAAFAVDFREGTISGAISDRSLVSAEPLILSETSISEGAFSGAAIGGGLTESGLRSATSEGSYSGLFTGADGQEIVGGVRILHTVTEVPPGFPGRSPGDTLTEVGGFFAGQTGP